MGLTAATGYAERIGGLQRMATLHAPVAVGTGMRKHRTSGGCTGNSFLILPDHALDPQPPVTVRTVGWQRCVIRFVDPGRPAPMRTRTVGGSGFAAGPARMSSWRAPRERCRLAVHRTARRLELLLQALVFPAQSVAFRLRPAQILAQPLNFASLLVDNLPLIPRRLVGGRLSDPVLMPDRLEQEKYKELITTI
jgi:hypothetical protein